MKLGRIGKLKGNPHFEGSFVYGFNYIGLAIVLLVCWLVSYIP